MRSGWAMPRMVMAGLVLAGLGMGMAPAPASAQQDDARLRKIEAEVRALQRQVFPGGDGRFFTPEVDTSQPQPQTQPGIPSTSALTDVLARLQAIEAQLTQLTARTEENANELALLKERVDLYHPPVPVAATAPQPTGIVPPPGVPAPGPVTAAAVPAPAAAQPAPAPRPVASGPTAARVAAVQAIAKPVSEDPGEDEYSYGFRLWEAGFYPEARQQLSLYLEKYPHHARVSYGRNLLGRAFLDDGQPRDAARYFLENYQSDKAGARAPDSLLYLSEAMIALGDTNRACIALAEFADGYPAVATGRLKSQYDRNRGRVDCR